MAKKKKGISWEVILVIALIAAIFFPSVFSTLIESVATLVAIGIVAFAIVFVIWLYLEKSGKRKFKSKVKK